MDYCLFSRRPLVLVYLAAIAAPGAASEFRETVNFAPIVERIEQYADKYGGQNVLVVVDVDNTLLAMDKLLGSDQWFEWQEHLLEHEPASAHLVADDFAGLLEVQGLLFATTHMHPPEVDQPKQVAAIQELGADTLVLTSRGEEFRAATLRELRRNGYDFSQSSPSIRLFERDGQETIETSTRFVPYDFDNPSLSGFMEGEATVFQLSDAPRQVSYGDGVFMVAGQHKGAMMLVLLHLIDKQYDAVVYVDDHGRHVSRVYDALVRRGIEVTTFHYEHEDSRVDRFKYGDKSDVTRRWQQIDRALEFFDLDAAPKLPEHATAGP